MERPVAGPGRAAARGPGLRRLPHRPPPDRRRGARSPTRRASSATRSSPTSSARTVASACPGSAGPAASATTAAPAARTSARGPASRAATSTAASPSTRSPTSATASRSPPSYPDEQAAPLLCAGLIGYRSLRMCGDAERIGFYGFGAAAHILTQVAVAEGRDGLRVHPRRRRGRAAVRARPRRRLGRAARTSAPPEPLDAAIIFAPVGALVPAALRGRRARRHRRLRRHPHERHPVLPLRAALGRADGPVGREPDPAPTARRCSSSRRGVPVETAVTTYPLEAANEALDDLRAGRFLGAAVIVPGEATTRLRSDYGEPPRPGPDLPDGRPEVTFAGRGSRAGGRRRVTIVLADDHELVRAGHPQGARGRARLRGRRRGRGRRDRGPLRARAQAVGARPRPEHARHPQPRRAAEGLRGLARTRPSSC